MSLPARGQLDGPARHRHRPLRVAGRRLRLRRGEYEAPLAELNRIAPPRPGDPPTQPWNWNSHVQVKHVLSLVGCEVRHTDVETLAAVNHPLARLLCRYRQACKRRPESDTDWLQHVAGDGRVHPTW